MWSKIICLLTIEATKRTTIKELKSKNPSYPPPKKDTTSEEDNDSHLSKTTLPENGNDGDRYIQDQPANNNPTSNATIPINLTKKKINEMLFEYKIYHNKITSVYIKNS